MEVKIEMLAELSKCSEGVGKSGAVLWLLIWLCEEWVAKFLSKLGWVSNRKWDVG